MIGTRGFDALWIAAGLLAGTVLAFAPADGAVAMAAQRLFHAVVEPFTRLLYVGLTCI